MRTSSLLLLLAALFAGASCGSPAASGTSFFIDTSSNKARATRDMSVDFELRAGQTLVLALPHGSIRVQTAPDAKPNAKVRMSLSAPTQEQADEYLARFDFTAEAAANGQQLGLRGERVVIEKNGGRTEFYPSADVVLTLPEGVNVDLRTRSGDVDTSGALAAAELESAYGNVKLRGARGAVRAHSKSGNVTVSDVEGDLDAKSGYGVVNATNVRGRSIAVASSSGNVALTKSSADEIKVETRYGSVELEELRGSVVGKSSSGRVTAADLQGERLRLESGYGQVIAKNIEGALSASSSSGDVTVENGRGALAISSRYGALSARGVWSAVNAESSSGSVDVRALPGSTLSDEWRLKSGYGAVRLFAPADIACELDATTRYGEARCEFALTIEAGARAKNGELRGRVGAGGPRVTLHSASGDVGLLRHVDN